MPTIVHCLMFILVGSGSATMLLLITLFHYHCQQTSKQPTMVSVTLSISEVVYNNNCAHESRLWHYHYYFHSESFVENWQTVVVFRY
jgi:hypothetical protein